MKLIKQKMKKNIMKLVMLTLIAGVWVGNSIVAQAANSSTDTNKPDITPPVVFISTPADNATVSGTVIVQAFASDNVGVQQLEVSVGTKPLPPVLDSSSTWAFTLNSQELANGTHTITARAVDTSFNAASTSITIHVQNFPQQDTTPPTIDITSHMDGETVSGIIVLEGLAFDNVAIRKVDVSIGISGFVTAVGTSSWTYTFNSNDLPDGLHLIATLAFDTSSNVGARGIMLKVKNGLPGPPPIVSFLNIPPFATLLGTVTVKGNSSDDQGVAFVEVKIDTQPYALASGTTQWSFVLDTLRLDPGSHSLVARVTNTSGQDAITTIPIGVSRNQVLNSGFEEDQSHWSFYPLTTSIDETIAHNGQKSAKINHSDSMRTYIVGETTPVDSDGFYNAAAWLKWSDITVEPGKEDIDGAYVLLQWIGESNVIGQSHIVSGNHIGSSDWVQFSETFKVPDHAVAVRPIFYAFNTKGTAWIDDIRIIKIVDFNPETAPPLNAVFFSGKIEQSPDGENTVKSGADATFRLGEVYSYPNPVRGGKKPTLHLEYGIADSVNIRIHDVTGSLVHEAKMHRGQEKIINGKYVYEYIWNTSGVASGVYYCRITAEKEGSDDIRIVKKLAIIK